MKVRRQATTSHSRLVVTLKNLGDRIEGPVYLVLDKLRRGVKLRKASGVTANRPPVGSPYVILRGSDAGATLKVVLRFKNPKNVAVRFTPRVLAGVGSL